MKGRFISRRLLFAVVFAALSAALAFQANPASSSLLRLMIGWFTANAIAVSFAYFTNSSWIFGKTEQGKLRWIPAVLMTPLLSFFRFVWTLQRDCSFAALQRGYTRSLCRTNLQLRITTRWDHDVR